MTLKGVVLVCYQTAQRSQNALRGFEGEYYIRVRMVEATPASTVKTAK
jgi:hypothetical protein